MAETTIGAVLFDGIEDNPYLNELYDAILYNYGRHLFKLTNLPEKEINVPAALRFADILSFSPAKYRLRILYLPHLFL